MNKLFSLQNIMTESSSITRSLIKTPVVETYLDSGISILKEFYDGIDAIRTNLYSSVLEASTRKEENQKFAEYFVSYKNLITKYQRDMHELVSRFKINVETFIDANKALIDRSGDTDFSGAPIIKVYKYENLDNDDIPNINVYKAFKHEFKFIGQMMQDLGSAVTDDEVKAKVLATVCNNLSKDISDGWIEKCMEKILDSDDCSKDNFATIAYKKFVPGEKEDLSVSAGEVQQARFVLLNSSAYVRHIESAEEKFNEGLNRVATEFGVMFFRNQDKELQVKTDVEGLADRNYHLTDYSFNQFNIFMATKSTQITELCNLYLIALTIKADCIFKYFQQCKDIIEAAYNGVDNTPNTDNDPGEDLDTPSDDIEDDIDSSDDIDNPDDGEGYEAPGMDDIENKDLDDSLSAGDTEGEPKTVVQDDEVEQEMEEAAYLFEALMFAADRVISENYIQESVQCLVEADLTNLKATAANAKSNFIEAFFNQISKLLQKFKKVTTENLVARINKVKKYENNIKGVEIPNGWKQDVIDTDKLLKLDIKDFNYTVDKEKLKSEDTYLDAYWKDYLSEDTSKAIKDRILNKLMSADTPYTSTQRDNGFKFLLSYESCMKSFDAQLNTLKSAQTKARSIAKNITESVTSLEEAMVMYFNEDQMPMPEKTDTSNQTQNAGSKPADSDPKPDDKQEQKPAQTDQNKDQNNSNQDEKQKKDSVKVYFSVNTKIMAAKMAIMQQAAKSNLNFLEKLLEISGADKNNNS